MKYYISTLIFIFFLTNIAFSQNWANQIGGTSIDQATSVAVDAVGNSYITGFFSNSINFSDGSLIASSGGKDIFIAKYNASGVLDWVKGIGGSGDDEGKDIAVDNSGNIYVLGNFANVVDFDPSANLALKTAQGSSDVFIAKFNNNGTLAQVNSIQGTGADFGENIDLDDSGNFYISGSFSGSLDFESTLSSDNLSATLNTNAAFFAKYSINSIFAWSKKIESPVLLAFTDMAATPNGVFLCGYYRDTTDFNPNAGIFKLAPAGNNDAFLAKYNANGSLVWANAVKGIDNEAIEGIHVNIEGNVLVTGHYFNSIDLEPNNNTFFVTSSGQRDLFFAQYSSNGAFRWGKTLGSPDDDFGYAITTDNQRRIFLAGTFQDLMNVNPNSGKVTNIDNLGGGTDVFYARYDSIGNFEWVQTAGGNNGELIADIYANNILEIYVAGWFQSGIGFFNNSVLFNSNGDRDALIAKVNTASPSVSNYNILENGRIDIFPNPVHDVLNIRMKDVELYDATIILTNILGEVVLQQSLNNTSFMNISIPESIGNGVYFVSIIDQQRVVYAQKVIILN
jgi:hypothetical protein